MYCMTHAPMASIMRERTALLSASMRKTGLFLMVVLMGVSRNLHGIITPTSSTKHHHVSNLEVEALIFTDDYESAFHAVLSRAVGHQEMCHSSSTNNSIANTTTSSTTTTNSNSTTNVPMLPEFGIIQALQDWMALVKSEKKKDAASSSSATSTTSTTTTQCQLPPTTSCHTTTYTAVFMSHSTDRLPKLVEGVLDIGQRAATQEIIVVWNAPRSVLLEDPLGRQLLKVHHNYDEAKTVHHTYQTTMTNNNTNNNNSTSILLLLSNFRIFFALEHGLDNDLLNRYHPLLKPLSEAVIYFDDDGPFIDQVAVSEAGLPLWQRHTRAQVGILGRNMRVLSSRMKTSQKEGMAWQFKMVNIHPKGDNTAATANDEKARPSLFTPTCRTQTGDTIEYNFFSHPPFGAHMVLPSGSILHRNYLCWIWHPALEELRIYIRNHPTHPDDQAVSALVTQLGGLPPYTYPRIPARTSSSRTPVVAAVEVANHAKEESDNLNSSSLHNASTTHNTTIAGQRHRRLAEKDIKTSNTIDDDRQSRSRMRRRLLWKQANWASMRQEAANSLVGYFGSLSVGSLGWCAGTDYQKARPRQTGGYVCEPAYPPLDLIPWIQPDGVGYDLC